jgi:hypothetical protein
LRNGRSSIADLLLAAERRLFFLLRRTLCRFFLPFGPTLLHGQANLSAGCCRKMTAATIGLS